MRVLGWFVDLLYAFLLSFALLFVLIADLPYRAWKERQIRRME